MLTGQQQIGASDWGVITSAQNSPLGVRAVTADGREFRYGLAGASNLAIGKLAQQPATVANHQVQAVQAAAAAGATSVSVTLGATLATANQYAGGYLVIQDSAGAGASYLISGHPAAALSATLVLSLAEPVTTALTTSSKYSLVPNNYNGMLISATTTVDVITGVPGIAVTAAFYGWFQTKGVAAVLGNGTPAQGSGVIPSATTAGATDVEATTTVTPRIGIIVGSAGVSTKYNATNLNIN